MSFPESHVVTIGAGEIRHVIWDSTGTGLPEAWVWFPADFPPCVCSLCWQYFASLHFNKSSLWVDPILRPENVPSESPNLAVRYIPDKGLTPYQLSNRRMNVSLIPILKFLYWIQINKILTSIIYLAILKRIRKFFQKALYSWCPLIQASLLGFSPIYSL